MNWFLTCVGFLTLLSICVVLPVCRHSTLPRRQKLVISLVIFLTLVPVGLVLYGWVGMPPMAAL